MKSRSFEGLFIMTETYDFAAIEAKWQRAWEEQNAFAAVADPRDVPLSLGPDPHGPRPQLLDR
jgi:hypothetical protein